MKYSRDGINGWHLSFYVYISVSVFHITRFAYMLLAMAVGLGQVLVGKGIEPESIPHRAFVTFPQIACMTQGK